MLPRIRMRRGLAEVTRSFRACVCWLGYLAKKLWTLNLSILLPTFENVSQPRWNGTQSKVLNLPDLHPSNSTPSTSMLLCLFRRPDTIAPEARSCCR